MGLVIPRRADDDGWYATGDIADRDTTGELAFVDRDSDEIKGSSGMIIPGAEVEDLLAGHPDVDDVVLVAFHPSEQAEAPAAVVVPVDGRAPTLQGPPAAPARPGDHRVVPARAARGGRRPPPRPPGQGGQEGPARPDRRGRVTPYATQFLTGEL